MGFFRVVAATLVAQPLQDRGYLVVGATSVMTRAPMTLPRYFAMDHVLVSPISDMRGTVDIALDALGHRRRVVTTVPRFRTALAAVTAAETIATLPARLARSRAAAMVLALAEPPLPIAVSTIRQRRDKADPRLAWAMALILCVTLAKGLPQG